MPAISTLSRARLPVDVTVAKRNLRAEPLHQEEVQRLHQRLIGHLGGRTPEEVDRMAKDDQNELIERFGGRDAALTKGTPAATPVPGKGHE